MRRDPMQRGRFTSFANGQTKPNGEYRVFNLAPGRYYVAASCQGPIFVPHPLSDQPPHATVRFLPQVYPGVSDFAAATMIDLAPGVERSGVDFRMAQGAVSNAVIKLFPPEPPQGGQLQVMLVPRDPFFQALQGMHGSAVQPEARRLSIRTPSAGQLRGGRRSPSDRLERHTAAGRTLRSRTTKSAEIDLPVGYGSELPGKIETDDGSPGECDRSPGLPAGFGRQPRVREASRTPKSKRTALSRFQECCRDSGASACSDCRTTVL